MDVAFGLVTDKTRPVAVKSAVRSYVPPKLGSWSTPVKSPEPTVTGEENCVTTLRSPGVMLPVTVEPRRSALAEVEKSRTEAAHKEIAELKILRINLDVLLV